MQGERDRIRGPTEVSVPQGGEIDRGHIERSVLEAIGELLDRKRDRHAAARYDELACAVIGRLHPPALEPRGVCHVVPFGEEHVVAEELPPLNAHADLAQDGVVLECEGFANAGQR
jgi:hypothetical protein